MNKATAEKTAVKIVEVSARDGLQNESIFVPTTYKLALLQQLAEAGLQKLEATSCVSQKRVPQMADYMKVLAGMPALRAAKEVEWSVLIANQRGLDTVLTAPSITEISLFTAASDAFTMHNIGCTVEESFARFAPLITCAKENNLRVRGYISTVIYCPYAKAVAPSSVAAVAERLIAMGCDEISLGDTVGVGTPKRIRPMLRAVLASVPVRQVAAHFHDTYGTALANIACAMEEGVRIVDAAVGGLGGCPFAPGAGGNVATEDVAYFMEAEGMTTGINMMRLRQTGQWICNLLARPYTAKAGLAAPQQC